MAQACRSEDCRAAARAAGTRPRLRLASRSSTARGREGSNGRKHTALLVNLTITGPQAAGFATAWPSGPIPGTSSINFAAGQSIAATTVVGCGQGASILVMANTVTDFLVDVIGYYQ